MDRVRINYTLAVAIVLLVFVTSGCCIGDHQVPQRVTRWMQTQPEKIMAEVRSHPLDQSLVRHAHHAIAYQIATKPTDFERLDQSYVELAKLGIESCVGRDALAEGPTIYNSALSRLIEMMQSNISDTRSDDVRLMRTLRACKPNASARTIFHEEWARAMKEAGIIWHRMYGVSLDQELDASVGDRK